MKSLAALSLSRVWHAQQRAQLRIQLYAIGRTHELLGEFAERARATLAAAAGPRGQLDAVGLTRAHAGLEREWAHTVARYRELLKALREDSASLPFGVLAVYQDKFVEPALRRGNVRGSGSAPGGELAESKPKQVPGTSPFTLDFVFRRQLGEIMAAADRNIYGDGLQLSQRLWRFDRESWQGIQGTLFSGIANQSSAWQIAKDLDQYLGRSGRCPRWTRKRLYGLTKGEISGGNLRGLWTNAKGTRLLQLEQELPEGEVGCDGRGIAYNALRLARTEIQRVHAQATDALMARMPWIEKERVHLSPDHAERDQCDDVVEGGEDGKGIYQKGEIKLPLHPHCLCFKTSVQQSPTEFAGRVRGWMRGDTADPALDRYAELLGQQRWSVSGSLALSQAILDSRIANSLRDWLWADPDSIERRLQGEDA